MGRRLVKRIFGHQMQRDRQCEDPDWKHSFGLHQQGFDIADSE
ncbi:Uncharacterised protein [Yersinia enterocolitica]|nr:Uncharacterised protein [Yersinia enterocolitica]